MLARGSSYYGSEGDDVPLSASCVPRIPKPFCCVERLSNLLIYYGTVHEVGYMTVMGEYFCEIFVPASHFLLTT